MRFALPKSREARQHREREWASRATDDAAWGRPDYRAGVRSDDGRRHPLSAGQAGGQLFGVNSVGAQFEQQAPTGIHQQAGQSLYAHVAGRERAGGEPSGRRIPQAVSASLSPHGQGSGQGGSATIGCATLLNAANEYRAYPANEYRAYPKIARIESNSR